MRYSTEHKEQSRIRIIEAARQLFRRRGFDGASIDQVMNQAGLTRGAFYAHFESKDDLIAQVLNIEAGLVGNLHRATSTSEPRTAALDQLAHYLDPVQRHDNATGCPLVAHPVDAIRGDNTRKEGYTRSLRALVESVEAILGGTGSLDDGAHDDAIVISVLTVGAALLSAASADDQLADQIEKVSLDKIHSILNQPIRASN
ncbi:MAG: TetR/AcrR family transcriptional regulator [Actinomycetota bacterium]|nr:TetR/AcrR family transcriptional regulator [Actinomycetota bacterium]